MKRFVLSSFLVFLFCSSSFAYVGEYPTSRPEDIDGININFDDPILSPLGNKELWVGAWRQDGEAWIQVEKVYDPIAKLVSFPSDILFIHQGGKDFHNIGFIDNKGKDVSQLEFAPSIYRITEDYIDGDSWDPYDYFEIHYTGSFGSVVPNNFIEIPTTYSDSDSCFINSLR